MPARRSDCRISTKKWSPPVVKQMLTKMSRTQRRKEFGKRWSQKDMQKLQERIAKTNKILHWIIKSSKLTSSKRATKKNVRKVPSRRNPSPIHVNQELQPNDPSDQVLCTVFNMPLIENVSSTFLPVDIPPFPSELLDFYTMEDWMILNTY